MHTHTRTYTNFVAVLRAIFVELCIFDTRIHTHIYMHTHTHTRTYKNFVAVLRAVSMTCVHLIHTYTHTHIHTRTHTHTHTRARTHTSSLSCEPSSLSCAYLTHTYTHAHFHTHAQTHTRTNTNFVTVLRAVFIELCIFGAHTHTHTHIHTHTHTHTHAHTHTLPDSPAGRRHAAVCACDATRANVRHDSFICAT